MTDRAWFSRFFMTFGQEMEWVYSYNPGARMGHCKIFHRLNAVPVIQQIVKALKGYVYKA